MIANARSWQAACLRWAGFFSASLGLLATAALLSSIWQDAPVPKLIQALLGIFGILLSYAIGKDLLDRARNREESAAWISNMQLRLASVSTKFSFVIAGLLVGLVMAFFAFYMIIASEPYIIFGMMCSDITLTKCLSLFR